MRPPSEKALDIALEQALKSDAEFARWFVSRTKFAGLGAEYLWSRADHPWGKFKVPVQSPDTGERLTIAREGETDVLAVFRTSAGRRIALHIENKRASGKFTPLQAALYRIRAEAWRCNDAYGNYEEWETVLLAPRSFMARFPEASRQFGANIAHEEVAPRVQLFATDGRNDA